MASVMRALCRRHFRYVINHLAYLIMIETIKLFEKFVQFDDLLVPPFALCKEFRIIEDCIERWIITLDHLFQSLTHSPATHFHVVPELTKEPKFD
jgi:hypothetical protein